MSAIFQNYCLSWIVNKKVFLILPSIGFSMKILYQGVCIHCFLPELIGFSVEINVLLGCLLIICVCLSGLLKRYLGRYLPYSVLNLCKWHISDSKDYTNIFFMTDISLILFIRKEFICMPSVLINEKYIDVRVVFKFFYYNKKKEEIFIYFFCKTFFSQFMNESTLFFYFVYL